MPRVGLTVDMMAVKLAVAKVACLDVRRAERRAGMLVLKTVGQTVALKVARSAAK